ncbi:MAG: 23S rRNA (guanosine(2251)-2'-O)-methyltransferase RlmB [Hyphomicrobiaceae bacterium]
MRDRHSQSNKNSREHVADGDQYSIEIWGIHAVEAALNNPSRDVRKLYLTENAANRLSVALDKRRIQPERVSPRDLDRKLGPDTVHQGALLETLPLEDAPLSHLAATSADKGPVVILDQVTDPHNVGAIMRSAAVFGSAGLVMTRRHSPPLAGALAKAASGALETVPVALVQNLGRAMAELTASGVTLIGLDSPADALLEDSELDGPLALVLGAEGRGLRQLTRQNCQHMTRILGDGPITSLNVSNAAAVSLHLAAMARRRRMQ